MIRHLVTAPIYLYRYLISPILGVNCRFAPSCSAYAIEVVQVHGVIHGLPLALRRIARCRPGVTWGYDPVPEKPHQSLAKHSLSDVETLTTAPVPGQTGSDAADHLSPRRS